jgi:hypothetical protein
MVFMAQIHQILSTHKNNEGNCSKASILESKMDVFYINLDRSENRRKYMESQLKYYKLNSNNRVRAVTIKDVVVPNEASVAKECLSKVPNSAISYVTGSTIFNPPLGMLSFIVFITYALLDEFMCFT